ncbi:MAG: hypothetical protein JO126_08385 [Alphaproteobacteria bacterium]|nr:hypothetical protein [Alphaproteobacteria bacterium]
MRFLAKTYWMAAAMLLGMLLSPVLPASAEDATAEQPAATSPAQDTSTDTASTAKEAQDQTPAPRQIDVTAEKSVEWYQDQHLYVARDKAKAVRGDLVVHADLLTAHERADSKKKKQAGDDTGSIDKLTAKGHVIITDQNKRVTGDYAVYDLDKHMMVVTGKNLRYETDKDTVTARDSLEYYEDTKLAVARGNAVADRPERHVEADILTALFKADETGADQLSRLSAIGNVTIVTTSDVTRGDKAVYEAAQNAATVDGHVRITRANGTQLTGRRGMVDFTTNQSKLLRDERTRVSALLPPNQKPGKGGEEVDNSNGSVADNHP